MAFIPVAVSLYRGEKMQDKTNVHMATKLFPPGWVGFSQACFQAHIARAKSTSNAPHDLTGVNETACRCMWTSSAQYFTPARYVLMCDFVCLSKYVPKTGSQADNRHGMVSNISIRPHSAGFLVVGLKCASTVHIFSKVSTGKRQWS